MKSYAAVSPPARVSKHPFTPGIPPDAADAGTDDLGCYLCGAVFIRKATREYIHRIGYVYCEHCNAWSQSKPPGEPPPASGPATH